eukprot:CAMPEP_0176493314 /NCGR_PEP_ID=MMETSP0200_2-20121128/9485_1 /TAXON_ID=947934 /ORGANISM="Chaetoceros sp., Strain GSL56" /LENGTH=639 /DNA_ID=CAMNT_0017890973 /DNA_START=57 /DNA_END=1976 /DNA_ORIENTATION=-
MRRPVRSNIVCAATTLLVLCLANKFVESAPEQQAEEEYLFSSATLKEAPILRQNRRQIFNKNSNGRGINFNDEKNGNVNLSSARTAPLSFPAVKTIADETSRNTGNTNGAAATGSINSRDLIIAGSDASVGSYTWYASLHDAATTVFDGLFMDGFKCGGQLVSPNFVLSAAHCGMKENDLVLIGNLCSIDTGNCGQNQVSRRVQAVVEDPLYETGLLGDADHDFVLLQLDQAVTTIDPVALDDGTYSPNYTNGKTLWAAGMGIVDTVTNTIPSRLQEVQLEYISDDVCRQESTIDNWIGDATLCTRHPAETGGICNGDSGGPLYDKENQVLVGITSYGHSDCTLPSPDVYGRISDKFSWIKSIICAQSQSASICSQTARPTTSPAPTSQWCDETHVEISINPDLFPEETLFYIKDMQSNEILTINSLEGFASDVTHKGDFCLPTSNKECYVFGIIDYYGDGIDVGGTDPDYCVKVNGQVVSCNTDFTGTLETVVFPEESCIQSCDPSSYSLTVTTTIASDFILIIKDESGNDIFPYTLNIASPYSTATVPVNLCRGCYQVYAENFDFATFFLVENETNDVVISKSQFPRSTSFVAFSVGGVEGCKVNTTNAAPPAREKASGIIFHVSLIMTLVMTVGVF